MDARAGGGIHAKDQIQLKKGLSQFLKGYDGNGYGLFIVNMEQSGYYAFTGTGKHI